MKTYKRSSKTDLIELVIPTDPDSPMEDLLDDCPLCQELKRGIRNGEVISVPFQIPFDDDEKEDAEHE